MDKKQLSLVWLLVLLLASTGVKAQAEKPESLLPYLHGLRAQNGALLLNIKGFDITSQESKGSFSKPWFSKMFPGFGLHKGYNSYPDTSLGLPGFRAEQELKRNAYDSR